MESNNGKIMLLIVAGIAAVVGISVGGFLQRVKLSYDQDLVKYEVPIPHSAVTTISPTVEPAVSPTVEDSSRAIAEAARQMERAVHDKDFIIMPTIKTVYEGYPVEFVFTTPTNLSKPRQSSAQSYYSFYHITPGKSPNPWDNDSTIINGFHRASTFGVMPLDVFEKIHQPFFGIKIYYDAPYDTWIYCVWSMKRKAPIPFPYPSKAVAFMKRQQGKK